MIRRLAFAAVLTLACAGLYGQMPVGAIPDVVVSDVKLSIDYPTRGGPHPLIVFSHASGGSNRSYAGLSSHWASSGYVVIRPAHVESRDRVADIKLVIDSLGTLAGQFPELQGKIDANRIAVAGHGEGAVTAIMTGDPRVKAIVALSPADETKTAELRVPALFMTGTKPAAHTQAFEGSPAGDKWLVILEDATDAAFTGDAGPAPGGAPSAFRIPSPSDPNPIGPEPPDYAATQQPRLPRDKRGPRALFGTVQSLTTAFFDAYMKEDANGRQTLEKAHARKVEVRKK